MGIGSQFLDTPTVPLLPSGQPARGTLYGLAANKPPANYRNCGCLYVATDTGAMWLSIGASWVSIAGGGGGGVSSVNATSPLASSGGATPDISLTGIVPVANGGTGTATPSLVAGSNVTISGSWPNQTVAASGGGGGVTSLNGETGAVSLVAGTNITLTPSGTNITIAASAGSGPGTILNYISIPANESTTSTTPVDLATAESISITLSATADVIVEYFSGYYNTSASWQGHAVIYLDGVEQPSTDFSLNETSIANTLVGFVCCSVLSAVAAGTHTIDMKHYVAGGTGHWIGRFLKATQGL